MLRILHVSPYYREAWAYGGIPRVVSVLATGLAARGHQVTVCTTDVRSAHERLDPAAAPMREDGVDVRVFRNVSNTLAYHLQLFLPRGLGAYLRGNVDAFDVAHIHACHNLPATIAARHLGRRGIPYVVSPHGTALRIERRRLAKLVFDSLFGRHLLADAERVVAVSEAERRQLAALGLAAERVSVIANPMDLSEFEPGVARGRFRASHGLDGGEIVMFLGKLTPRKRLDVLAAAMRRLARPDARLVIAGNDMGYERMLRGQLEGLGLLDRTLFTGLLTGRERLEALADADVLVYPSQAEVFGLVPVEALMCGTPVVVADDSGCGDVVRQVGGGLVVREGDDARLAEAIAQVLDAPAEWRAAAAAAQTRIRSAFDSGVIVQSFEKLYGEIAN